jgi:hypothetical protein
VPPPRLRRGELAATALAAAVTRHTFMHLIY